jgi:PhzF family phenazine biosynthesis protein
MQRLAAEMNLSETAFLLPEGDGWRLRWFTPKTEVNLCGHATLASAYVLFETRPELRDSPLMFMTRSGKLGAAWHDRGVTLDFPAMTPEPVEADAMAAKALGLSPVASARCGDYFLFEARDAETVCQARPDFSLLATLPMPEVIITAPSETEYDFISRFFAPQLGVDEDPVTGSAHCLLGPYWAQKMSKTSFKAFQASERGGELDVTLTDDRVRLTGAARIVFKAELLV